MAINKNLFIGICVYAFLWNCQPGFDFARFPFLVIINNSAAFARQILFVDNSRKTKQMSIKTGFIRVP